MDRANHNDVTPWRDWLIVLLVIALLIAFSIILHTVGCSTPMEGLTDQQWQERVEGHLTLYPFHRRIPFTWSVVAFHTVTGWPYRQSFYAVEYFLLALTAILFYRLLRFLRFDFAWGVVGMLFFLSAYPVLHGFAEPVHTWDDIWVYALMILTTWGLLRGKVFWAVLAFTLALYGREQSVTYYPLFAAGVWIYSPTKNRWWRIAAILAPAALFAPFFLPGWVVPTPRDQIRDINWGSDGKAANSWFSTFMSFGPLWLAYLFGLLNFFRKRQGETAPHERAIVWGSLYAVLVTLVVVFQVGFIRETRLLFHPFVWLIPVTLWGMRDAVALIVQKTRWIIGLLAVASLAALHFTAPLGAWIFPALDYRNCPILCQRWFSLEAGLTIVVLLIVIAATLPVRRRIESHSMR